ncbi:hypothetical protein QR680_014727 [Steinernema hermaphroditum]|uniref:FLYWCH-type domain-containing protein n=1 Tax=Steinernema hermaphroditum TaxID=289476 RepID=A0AA39ICK8_9BILA|nr:hypothetical protein QR680_014727 [Steinernema hermaphroditum]
MDPQRTVQKGGAQVHQHPQAADAPNWRVMKTLRGGFRVIVDEHLFIDQKVMRNPDHIRFTCIERKPLNCRCAVIMTKDHRTFIKLDQTHNHAAPDPSVYADLYDLDQDTSTLTKSSRKSRSRRTTENTVASDRGRIHSESMMEFEEDEDPEPVAASPGVRYTKPGAVAVTKTGAVPGTSGTYKEVPSWFQALRGEVKGPSTPILSDDIVTLIFHQMTHEERIRAKSVSRYFNHISKQFLPTPNFKLNAELYISPTKRGPARYTFKAYNEQRCFSGLFPNRPDSWPSFLRIVSLNITTAPTDGRGAINPDDVNVICTMLKHRAMWGISTLSMYNVDLIHVNFDLSETFFAHLMRAKFLKMSKVVNICEDFGYLLEHLTVHSKRLQCIEMINCTMVEPDLFDNDLVMKCLRRYAPIQMDLSSFDLECKAEELTTMMNDLINRDPGLEERLEEERSIIICSQNSINLAEVAQDLGTAFEDDSFIVARAMDEYFYVVKVQIITERQLRFSARYAKQTEFSEYLSPAKPSAPNA